MDSGSRPWDLGRNDAKLIGPVAQNEQIKTHYALVGHVPSRGLHEIAVIRDRLRGCSILCRGGAATVSSGQ
jgi:hypothetical protein